MVESAIHGHDRSYDNEEGEKVCFSSWMRVFFVLRSQSSGCMRRTHSPPQQRPALPAPKPRPPPPRLHLHTHPHPPPSSARCASSRSSAGSVAGGYEAQHAPSIHRPAHALHHATPSIGSPSLFLAVDSATRQASCVAQQQHCFGGRCRAERHLARPGSPLQSKRRTLPASVMVAQQSRRRHSSPCPGAHRRPIDRSLCHAK